MPSGGRQPHGAVAADGSFWDSTVLDLGGSAAFSGQSSRLLFQCLSSSLTVYSNKIRHANPRMTELHLTL